MHFPLTQQNKTAVIAQITDSHLFADQDGLHHGQNVFLNLTKVLFDISCNPGIDCIVFTGDLSQDHTEQSYQNFVDAVQKSRIKLPIFYVAGNHDEQGLLDKYFSTAPFMSGAIVELEKWQIQLITSKSDTPAGFVSDLSFEKLNASIDMKKWQLLMMHHHPIDVGYFIDKHGLQNKQTFWQKIAAHNNIRAIACGHVHGAMTLTHMPVMNKSEKEYKEPPIAEPVMLYTCPATSIQFDPTVDGVAALDKGPGYQLFHLHADGSLQTEVIYV